MPAHSRPTGPSSLSPPSSPVPRTWRQWPRRHVAQQGRRLQEVGLASLPAAVLAALRGDSGGGSGDNYPVGGNANDQEVERHMGFSHLLRRETWPAICSLSMKYRELGPSYPGAGKLIYKHDIDFLRGRWKWGFDCRSVYQCARSGEESRGGMRYNPPRRGSSQGRPASSDSNSRPGSASWQRAPNSLGLFSPPFQCHFCFSLSSIISIHNGPTGPDFAQ